MPFYAQKCDFGPKPPKWGIWAQTPQNLTFLEFFDFIRIVLLIRFQQALNSSCNIIFSYFMTTNVFLGPNPQNGRFGPKRPKNFNFLEFFHVIRIVLLIRLQQARNRPCSIIFSHFMHKNVILGPNS